MLTLAILALLGYLLCFGLVRHMASPAVGPAAQSVLALAWLLCLASLFTINVDIYQSLRLQRAETPLVGIWRCFYWGSFFLGYIFFAVLGESELHEKSSALRLWMRFYRRRLRFFALCGALALCAVFWLLWRGVLALGSLDALPKLITNAIGLLLIVLILGYSLPELPRKLRRGFDPAEELDAGLVTLGRKRRALQEREYGLEHAVASLSRQLGRAEDAPRLGALREAVRGLPFRWEGVLAGDAEGRAEEDCRATLEETLEEAQEYRRRAHKLQRRISHARKLLLHVHGPPLAATRLGRLTYTLLRPLLFRALFALSCALSTLILLLIIANFVDAPRAFLADVLRRCPAPLFLLALNGYLGYFALLIVFGLSRLKFQRFRGVTPRNTDLQSLLHLTRHALRMAIPLLVNLLQVLQLEETQFSAVMGRPHFLPMMGDRLLRAFPALLLLLLLLRLSNAYDRVMRVLGLAEEGCASPEDCRQLLAEAMELVKQGQEGRRGRVREGEGALSL